jgi:hypothetical protein
MNPYQLERLASRHNEELRAEAHLARRHVQRPGPRNSVRHRAGWTLVELGLRLAGGSDA